MHNTFRAHLATAVAVQVDFQPARPVFSALAAGFLVELFLGADRFRLGSLHLPYEQREDSTDVWQNTLESCTQVLATFPSQNPVFLGCDLNQPLHVAVDHFPPLVQLRLLMSRFLLRPSDDVGPTWHARGLSAAIDFVLFRHPGMLGVTTSRADIRLALPSDHDMVQVSFSHYWPSAGPAQQPRNRGEQNFFSAMTFRLLVPAPFSPICRLLALRLQTRANLGTGSLRQFQKLAPSWIVTRKIRTA